MSAQQGELFTNTQNGQKPRDAAPKAEPEPAPVWMQSLSLIVLVIFCFYIGGLLALLPWWARYWQQNGWLMGHPMLYDVLQRGWVRGVISGLGLVDVWIGISEMMHYRDYRP